MSNRYHPVCHDVRDTSGKGVTVVASLPREPLARVGRHVRFRAVAQCGRGRRGGALCAVPARRRRVIPRRGLRRGDDGYEYGLLPGHPLRPAGRGGGHRVPRPRRRGSVGLARGRLSAAIPYSLDHVVLRMAGTAYFALLHAILPLVAAVVGRWRCASGSRCRRSRASGSLSRRSPCTARSVHP